MFSVSVNAFSVEFLLACYQQAGRVWYVSGALRRTYMLFYPAPLNLTDASTQVLFLVYGLKENVYKSVNFVSWNI